MSYFPYDSHQIYFECYGRGNPLLLLHGNTASSRMFDAIIPKLAEKHQVITIDFLGCGRSDRLASWSSNLWVEWSKQVYALCRHLNIHHVNIIGTSGGALAAINAALAYPQLVRAIAADSFAGIASDPAITSQIQASRAAAKQFDGFRAHLQSIHGDDWERVLDADTDAVTRHANEIGTYFQLPLSALQCRMLLTGSAEDEMFPAMHFQHLFEKICRQTPLAQAHIFPHGGHPAMLSNMDEFILLLSQFLSLSDA